MLSRVKPDGIKQLMPGSAIIKSALRPKHCCAPGAFLFAVLLVAIPADFALGSPAAADRIISEYEVKAAYIYNFAKFVEWPQSAFSEKSAPIIIGIIGDDEFGALLGKVVKDRLIQEHTIQVHILKWPADLRACHILYVASSEQRRFRQMAESLQAKAVLTITEAEDRSLVKGIMNLFVEGGKVQFEINIDDAEKAKLKISSKLLRLARGTVGSYSGRGE